MGKDGNIYSNNYIQKGNIPQFRHFNEEENIFTDLNLFGYFDICV